DVAAKWIGGRDQPDSRRSTIERHQRNVVAEVRLHERGDVGPHVEDTEADGQRDEAGVKANSRRPGALVTERRLVQLPGPRRTIRRRFEEPRAQVSRPSVSETDDAADV